MIGLPSARSLVLEPEFLAGSSALTYASATGVSVWVDVPAAEPQEGSRAMTAATSATAIAGAICGGFINNLLRAPARRRRAASPSCVGPGLRGLWRHQRPSAGTRAPPTPDWVRGVPQ